MPESGNWQVRRVKGRRIYTGLSRTQVERALRTGKLTTEDLALPPGESRWMKIPVALVHTGQEPIPVAPAATKVSAAEWVPMEQEGRLIKPEPEGEDPADMDMTPMIDVTTLLLIFFLVGGVFMLQADIELPKSKTGTPEMPAERKPVGILIDTDVKNPAGGTISFEDARDDSVPLDDVAEGYRKRVSDGAMSEAMIKAHRAVPFGLVRQTMMKLTEAGVSKIMVGVEESK